MEAAAMDIANVRAIAAAEGDPSKYDTAIAMMLTYVSCLAATGAFK